MGVAMQPRLPATVGLGNQRRSGGSYLSSIAATTAFIDEEVAGHVDEDDAVLHLADGPGVDHAFGGIKERYMDGDVVTFRKDVFDPDHVVDLALRCHAESTDT